MLASAPFPLNICGQQRASLQDVWLLVSQVDQRENFQKEFSYLTHAGEKEDSDIQRKATFPRSNYKEEISSVENLFKL